MIGDMWTVMWKEFRELPRVYGGGRKGWIFPVVFLGIFSVWMPLNFGRMWVDKPFVMGFAPMMSLSFMLGFIPDSFAGERERQTLETLLASRLSDRGILFGKVAAYGAVGVMMAAAMLCMALVTVNAANRGGGLLIYEPRIFFGALGASLLTATLAAGAGVLVSLRASTVRQAQQVLTIALWGLIALAVVASRVLMKLPKRRVRPVIEALEGFGVVKAVLVVVAVLVVADVLLILAAMARFKRARLILD